MSKIITFCFTSEKAKELYNNEPPLYETPFASGFDLRAVDILYNFTQPYVFKDKDKKYYSTFFDKVADDSQLLYVCRYKKNDINTPDLILLMPQGRILVKTGIRISMPIIGTEIMDLQIRSRSGACIKSLNGIGTIDSDYRGELGVILHNAGNKAVEINIGDRIAQGVFNPLQQCIWQKVSEEDFDKNFCNTKRGSGGFGSTGK